MNDFSAKKIGDALAIERVGLDTIEKARDVFNNIFGNDKTSGMVLAMKHHAELLDGIIVANHLNEYSIQESNEIIQKIFSMRDGYVGYSWDNPMKVAEWIGFFNGGALVHWKIIRGIAEKEENSELKDLSLRCLEFYEEGLNSLSQVTFDFGVRGA